MSYLRPGRFEVIAHRGGGLEAPENTLTAFEHSANLYDEMVFELDVHLSRDGEVIVIHDPTVDRTTDGHGPVGQMNAREIAKLDAGYRFSSDGGKTFPFRGKGARHPLLSEVLRAFPRNRVSIEVKHAYPSFEDKVINIIQKAGADDRVVLAGEDHLVLERLRKYAPHMCSGFSKKEIFITFLADKVRLPGLAPRRGDVLQIPLFHGNLPVYSSRLLLNSHRQGKFLHVWTVNDEATMRYLVSEGVDGLITDAPSLLLSIARQLKKI